MDHIYVYIYLRPFNLYISPRTYTLLYLYVHTCFYAHINIRISILPLPYTYIWLHTSSPMYTQMFTSIYNLWHSIHAYIHVRPYTRYTCFYTPTSLYAQYISAYFEAHIRPTLGYIPLCYMCLLHDDILLHPHKCFLLFHPYPFMYLHSSALHTFSTHIYTIYLNKFTYLSALVPLRI